jgi:alkylhydroperoxidase/carboxymuconolactone decarboxylase family protein YurZ
VKEGALTAAQENLTQEFVRNRGYWNPVWNQLLQHRRGSSTPIRGCHSVPWHGTLAPKIRELIDVAIDVATTHLCLSWLGTHIRGALGHGATVDEIMEVRQLTSVLGIHANTDTEGVPVLLREATRAGKT